MISKILIASIRARLTEVTTLGEHRKQAFLKLAHDYTLNIQRLFKNALQEACRSGAGRTAH